MVPVSGIPSSPATLQPQRRAAPARLGPLHPQLTPLVPRGVLCQQSGVGPQRWGLCLHLPAAHVHTGAPSSLVNRKPYSPQSPPLIDPRLSPKSTVGTSPQKCAQDPTLCHPCPRRGPAPGHPCLCTAPPLQGEQLTVTHRLLQRLESKTSEVGPTAVQPLPCVSNGCLWGCHAVRSFKQPGTM